MSMMNCKVVDLAVECLFGLYKAKTSLADLPFKECTMCNFFHNPSKSLFSSSVLPLFFLPFLILYSKRALSITLTCFAHPEPFFWALGPSLVGPPCQT